MSEEVSNEQAPQENKGGFFSRLKQGLTKTRESMAGGIGKLFKGKGEVGPELLDELEESLLLADVGTRATEFILDELKRGVRDAGHRERQDVMAHLKRLMVEILEENQRAIEFPSGMPLVLLVIGVNGSGKTTTIGKLAARWKMDGKKVVLGAGDTFRAAAIEQLQEWARRTDIPCIHQKSGADPSAVAYDTVQAAVNRKLDAAIIDTAGRLQTNVNLMEELKKVKRVIGKVLPSAPHETLLVLDASIGQNSLSQARLFHEALSIDGLVMTKLDGSAKGGVLLNLSRELGIPVRYVGVGEKVEDLQEFNAKAFVEALVGE
ncbi:MAG: signal recognition particle-docking protein FtsY [Nitrospinae bacterium CG11_big_fil_rev_8_21_14_0_20_56_8]|nr:MAG: signal recognition particle-docking protein FtsY [Nitrospinae bacterium CG11_big_fil_rev_8_21_14_0_20_56_8]